MFFTLSKIFWFFLQPTNVLIMGGLVGLVLSLTRRPRGGRVLMAAALVGIAVAGFSPLGSWIILPLEERFALPDPAEEPDGIVVLGGSFDTHVSLERGTVSLTDAAERLTTMVELARRYPSARLVFSGGAADFLVSGMREADVARQMLEGAGVDTARVTFEDRSRNTWQNAILTRELITPGPDEVWWLITSAYHMPRAVGAFRQAGFRVGAYPVDFRTSGRDDLAVPFSKASEGLRRVDIAVREWIGLVVYRVTGRSNALFPAP
jgi:uncharacterized SAM-binding protein YcdF (DUF218 family)